jgi:geranylgeranyl diphosphate synthase, type I
MEMNIEEFLEETAQLIDRLIEKYIPRKFSPDSIAFQNSPPRFSYNVQALDSALSEPIWDLLDRGGKRWRPALFLTICDALGKNHLDYLDLAIIPEVVHNGTLMHDDIEDLSELRRGKPCTYKIFGTDVAINAANSMYYLPLLTLRTSNKAFDPETIMKVYEVYVEEMINLSFGQAMDIAWHKGMADADKISEEDYLQMCAYKTGTLARMAAKIAAVVCGADNNLVRKLGVFAESIGVAFQIQDDILDITGTEFALKKGGLGQDITEGKRTMMVIHTLKVASKNEKARLLQILDMHTPEPNLKNEAISLMEKYDSVEYSRKLAIDMISDSWRDLELSFHEGATKERLKDFVDFLVKRNM